MVIKLWLPLWVFVLFSCKGYGLGTAEIIFVRGKVEICSASMQFVQVAKKGDSISAKQGIRTYVDGLLILQLEDSSIIKIDPNSVILVETLIKKDHNKLKGHFGLQINAGAVIIHARKSNYPRIDRNQPLFEVRYLDTVIELNKGKLLAGVDLTNNNLWVSVKEGQAKIINFVWGKYVDLKFGYSVWVELGQLLSMPGKYAWPLRLNWQMNPEKNARLQSNFYALEITRQDEWKDHKQSSRSGENSRFSTISAKRMKELHYKKIQTEELFTKFNQQTKPEKISILSDEKSSDSNKKLQSSRQQGILDFN